MLAATAFFCSVNTAGINAAANVALLTFEGGLSQKRVYKSASSKAQRRKADADSQPPACPVSPAGSLGGAGPMGAGSYGVVAAPNGSEHAGREGKRQPGWLCCLLCTGDDAVVSFSC